MEGVVKLVDRVLCLFFFLMAIFAPFLDAQFCVPLKYQPQFLIHFSSWCASHLGYYLVVEKPSFYVGFAWMELCVSWPLSIANLFGIIYGNSWFNTTCLIQGVSLFTSLVAILSELIGSGKAPDKLKMIYYFFLGISVLVTLRGLLPSFCEIQTAGKKPFVASRYKKTGLNRKTKAEE